MSNALRDALRPYCDEKDDWSVMRKEFYIGVRLRATTIEQNCICGVPIAEMCYIIHRRTKKLIIVGNKCIAHFNELGLPLCPECEIYPIEKITHHTCKNCKSERTRPTGEVRFGKHKGKPYAEVFSTEPMYCLWALKESFGDTHFTEYCRRRYYERFGEVFQYTKRSINDFLTLRSEMNGNVPKYLT